MKRLAWLPTVIGILFATGGLWFFFKGMDPAALLLHLRHSSPWAIIAAALLSIISLYFRGKRWAVMLPAGKGRHTKGLVSITAIGFMVNNILPARIGEAVRMYLLWKKNGFSGAVSVGSVVVERMVDTFFYGLLFGIAVMILPPIRTQGLPLFPGLTVAPDPFRQIAAIILLGCGAAVIAAAWYSFYPAKVRRMLGVVLNILPASFGAKMRRLGREIFSSIDWLFSGKKCLAITGLSLATLICFPLIIFVLAGDFHAIALVKAIFVQGFAVVGAAIPFAPGFVGTLHALVLQAFLLLGTERANAMAITILCHGISYIASTAFGFYFFFKDGMSLKEITTQPTLDS
ncbi:MAG: lysylphosphatidylglycerol synthase transmembrane domain-containing protein [Chitinivibrionales bacterium]|nr:lysylphosphatidylglycerol synthase transmembrane domain-containing protein [Chitinivibrionales bacterium]